jgi:hypothetical protein
MAFESSFQPVVNSTGETAWLALAAWVGCVLGETFERYLFFAAVSAPRMPGGVRQ